MRRAHGELMGAGSGLGLALAGGHLTAVSPGCRCSRRILGLWRAKGSRSQVRCQALPARKAAHAVKYQIPEFSLQRPRR